MYGIGRAYSPTSIALEETHMPNPWILTDVAAGKYEEKLTITPPDVGGKADGYSIVKKTLRGGLADGVDTITIDNGKFSFIVLPTRGMSIWKAWLNDAEIGWQSPVHGPVHPKYVPLNEPSGLGWLDGFDELLVRCGLESNGAPEFDEQSGSYPGNSPKSRPGGSFPSIVSCRSAKRCAYRRNSASRSASMVTRARLR